MTQTQTFNFHDLVGVQVDSDDPQALQFFAREYQFARGPLPEGAPSVHLKWHRSSLPLRPGPGFRLHIHKVLARWYYSLDIGDDQIEIEAAGNRLAIAMLHHMLVHPSLRLLASRRGALMLHGAAVVHQGRSMILTGQGGVGKTTTSTLLLAYGGPAWKLHADDYLFLLPGPQTRSYLTSAHLYRNLLAWLPELDQRLSAAERLQLRFYWALRRGSREHVKWPVRLSMERLWPGREAVDQAKLGAFILLDRDEVVAPHVTRLAQDQVPLEAILAMNFHEARHFIKLVGKADGGRQTPDWLQAWRQRERENLEARLAESDCFRLVLPAGGRPTPEQGKDLVRILEGLV